MGVPSVPKPTPLPAAAHTDPAKAQLMALAYADTQRRIRMGAGRRASFLTSGSPSPQPNLGGSSALGA